MQQQFTQVQLGVDSNPRLPPSVIGKPWTYNSDSWTWQPKLLEREGKYDTYCSLGNYEHCYRDIETSYRHWLQREGGTENSLLCRHDGMTETDAQNIENAIMNYPDLKSQTLKNERIFNDFQLAAMQRGLLPMKAAYLASLR